jgi:hypothetical protein
MSARWIPVGSENSLTELILEEDPRLVRAVGSVVDFLGERIGMAPAARKELAEAAEASCLEIFPLLGNHRLALKVIVADYPDRIEVILEHTGAEVPQKTNSVSPSRRVDQVLRERRGDISRTTLVKFVSKQPATN